MDHIAVKDIISSSKGKFFSVEFIKRTTGESRKMVCRLGVKKHLKGGSLPYTPKDHKLVVVWDSQKKDYRTIPCDSVIKLTVNGITHN